MSKIDGRDLPVLVEVKATDDDELVWSDRYLQSLRRFAQLLRLPLLIAWKRCGFWALVDVAHFELRQTAHHLTFERAMKENLMSLLCGEVFIALNPAFQFIITAEVVEPLPPVEQLLPESTYTLKITNIGFFTEHGRIADLADEFFWLFASCTETNHVERPTQQTITAIHHPEPETTFPLTRVLLAQVAWSNPDDADVDWSAELRRRQFPSAGTTYRNMLPRGIELGVIQYVLKQAPNTTPPFLTPLRTYEGS